MIWAVRFLGILILGYGCVVAISPSIARKVIDYFSKGERIYMIGVLRILFGLAFLFAAPQCRFVGVVRALGAVLCAAGVLIFILGPERVHAIFRKWENKPDTTFRLLSLFAIAFGAFILYAA